MTLGLEIMERVNMIEAAESDSRCPSGCASAILIMSEFAKVDFTNSSNRKSQQSQGVCVQLFLVYCFHA